MRESQMALLGLLQEECAEVIQAVSKVRRSGADFVPFNDPEIEPYEPGRHRSNIENVRTEIMDVLVLVEMLGISDEELALHRERKVAKLRRWAPEVFHDA